MRTVGVRLVADVSAFSSSLKRAGGDTKDFLGELDKSARKGNLDAVADKAGVAGLALVGLAGYAIKAAADFDKSMSAVSAATHASQGDLEQLRKAALQAGKDTQYSATEAANGITELSKAGVSTADVLGGGLKGALALAAAGQIDVADAAETAASAMTIFKLKGDQIPHVADLLAAAAGKAQGSVADMAAALNQSGLIAAQTGLSIEDTTGTLAAFASAGLIGSDAGTSFKTMLQALQAPSGKTKDLMKELGISAYDAQGNFVGITALAGQLKSQLGKLTPELRANALAQIFGSDATRAASVLYEQGATGIQGWIDKTNEAGYASQTAAKLTDNLSGDLERLKGSLETMAIEGGGGANSGLRVIVKALSALVDEFGKLPPAVGGTVVVLSGLSGLVLLGIAGWAKYRAMMASVNEQLVASGPAGEKAAAGLTKASKAASVAGLAFLGLEVVKTVFGYFGPAAADVGKLTDALTEFARSGKATGEMSAQFGKDLSGFRRDAGLASQATGGMTKSINDLLNTIGAGSIADWMAGLTNTATFNTATADLKSYDAALTSVMTTSGSAKDASKLWNDTLQQSGLDTEQLAKLLPDAYAKVGELNKAQMAGADAAGAAGTATASAADATKKYTTEADAAAGAARGEAAAISDLSARMKAQADPVFALLEAEKGLADAQKAAGDATKTHGRNSDQAREATRKLALAAITLQGAAGGLGNTFNGKLTPSMIATLKAAGLTKSQIEDVARQFRSAKKDADAYDGKYAANVSAPGAAGAAGAVRGLRSEISKLYGKQINIDVHYSTSGLERVDTGGHRIGGYKAAGGPIVGAGTGTSDSVAIMASNGEHMWTAAEVQAVGGHGAMAQMRSAALSPGQRYAGGGAVSRTTQVVQSHTWSSPAPAVAEVRISFADVGNDLGQLFAKALRTSPGLRTTVAKQLGVKVA